MITLNIFCYIWTDQWFNVSTHTARWQHPLLPTSSVKKYFPPALYVQYSNRGWQRRHLKYSRLETAQVVTVENAHVEVLDRNFRKRKSTLTWFDISIIAIFSWGEYRDGWEVTGESRQQWKANKKWKQWLRSLSFKAMKGNPEMNLEDNMN